MTDQPAQQLTNEEWTALHDQLFKQTKTQFFQILEQFLLMNWPVARLVHWTLSFYE